MKTEFCSMQRCTKQLLLCFREATVELKSITLRWQTLFSCGNIQVEVAANSLQGQTISWISKKTPKTQELHLRLFWPPLRESTIRRRLNKYGSFGRVESVWPLKKNMAAGLRFAVLHLNHVWTFWTMSFGEIRLKWGHNAQPKVWGKPSTPSAQTPRTNC